MQPLIGMSLLLAVSAFGGFQSPTTDAAVSAQEQTAIRSAYRAMSRAFEQHHPSRMRRYLAATFSETRQGSATTRNREQFLQEIAEECEHALAPIRVDLELKRFARAGSDVIVSVDEDTTYRVRGDDGKLHAIEYRQKSEDHWVRQSGVWKCIQESDQVPYLTRIDNRDVTLQQLGKLLQ